MIGFGEAMVQCAGSNCAQQSQLLSSAGHSPIDDTEACACKAHHGLPNSCP